MGVKWLVCTSVGLLLGFSAGMKKGINRVRGTRPVLYMCSRKPEASSYFVVYVHTGYCASYQIGRVSREAYNYWNQPSAFVRASTVGYEM
jgi:hypothetical protein